MGLKINHPISHPDLIGLVDDINGCTDFNTVKQILNIFRVEPDTTMTDPHSNTVWFVGPVYKITGNAQAQRIITQGIIRSGLNHLGQRIVILLVFLANGFRRIPGRISGFLNNLGLDVWCCPTFTTNPERIGKNTGCFARIWLREKIQTHFRNIQYDAFSFY